jgi:hypothetical protein
MSGNTVANDRRVARSGASRSEGIDLAVTASGYDFAVGILVRSCSHRHNHAETKALRSTLPPRGEEL